MKQNYPRLTVDPVMFAFIDDELCVLLVRRTADPEKGKWGLPGAHSFADSRLSDSLMYGLRTKTNVQDKDIAYIEQLHAFDDTGLDPRGHAVTITYLLLTSKGASLSLNDGAEFVPVAGLKKSSTAFDHNAIIIKARERLIEKLEKTSIAVKIMPKEFTLNQLHRLYESAYGRELDNRNFRKKYLSLNVLEETGNVEQGVKHRPSKYMRFASKKVDFLITSFR